MRGTVTAYAKYRRAKGLHGGTLRAVQKARDSGRIVFDADGSIDFARADKEWEHNSNVTKRRNQKGKPEGEPEVDECECGLYRAGQIDSMNQLRHPKNLLVIAETALAFGCTLKQAILLAWWYDFFLAIWVADEGEEIIETHPDPDWAALAARIGEKVTPAEVKRWVKGSGPAVEKWDAAHPRG